MTPSGRNVLQQGLRESIVFLFAYTCTLFLMARIFKGNLDWAAASGTVAAISLSFLTTTHILRRIAIKSQYATFRLAVVGDMGSGKTALTALLLDILAREGGADVRFNVSPESATGLLLDLPRVLERASGQSPKAGFVEVYEGTARWGSGFSLDLEVGIPAGEDIRGNSLDIVQYLASASAIALTLPVDMLAPRAVKAFQAGGLSDTPLVSPNNDIGIESGLPGFMTFVSAFSRVSERIRRSGVGTAPSALIVVVTKMDLLGVRQGLFTLVDRQRLSENYAFERVQSGPHPDELRQSLGLIGSAVAASFDHILVMFTSIDSWRMHERGDGDPSTGNPQPRGLLLLEWMAEVARARQGTAKHK